MDFGIFLLLAANAQFIAQTVLAGHQFLILEIQSLIESVFNFAGAEILIHGPMQFVCNIAFVICGIEKRFRLIIQRRVLRTEMLDTCLLQQFHRIASQLVDNGGLEKIRQ